jgi:hypothetical protein
MVASAMLSQYKDLQKNSWKKGEGIEEGEGG